MADALKTSAVKRAHGWEARLLAARQAEVAQPFQHGERDCLTSPCNLFLALTGVDFAAPWRGAYRDRAGAAKVMQDYAGGGVEETVAKIAQEYGLEEIRPAFARRGDAVLFDAQHGPMLGVVDFDGVHALVRVRRGLQPLPLAQARRAWRIG